MVGYQTRLEQLKAMIDEVVQEAEQDGVTKKNLYNRAWNVYTLGKKTVDRCIGYRVDMGVYLIQDEHKGEEAKVVAKAATHVPQKRLKVAP